MSKKEEPIIEEITSKAQKDFTRITFKPDLKKFGLNSLTDDIVFLFEKRVYDISGTTSGIKVYLNDKVVKINNFTDYVKMYIPENLEKETSFFKEKNERWEVCLINSPDQQYQQISFVNSLCTTKG